MKRIRINIVDATRLLEAAYKDKPFTIYKTKDGYYTNDTNGLGEVEIYDPWDVLGKVLKEFPREIYYVDTELSFDGGFHSDTDFIFSFEVVEVAQIE